MGNDVGGYRMTTTSTLKFAELVLNRCSRTYGISPCAAAIGVTGDYKCYNSPRTCQDAVNFLGDDEQIIRWAMPTSDLPIEIDADPRITSISRRPQLIDPGESLGVRESGTVTLSDSLHNDVQFDNYIADRGYNTYLKGTYWGKFFARWGNIQGNDFYIVDGVLGQNIDDMSRRFYIVEATNGPDSQGNYSITFKDVIKFADSDKAQAPLPSGGKLAAGVAAPTIGSTFTLSPAGIGALEYPASGTGSIGDTIVTFTRVGDVITLTGVGLYGSSVDDFEADETFQLALMYSAEDPADIFNDLLSYTDTPAAYYDYPSWIAETTEYIGRLYTAIIPKPTPVKTLLNELISEVGLIVWTDLTAKKIALRAMRQFVPTLTINDDFIIAGSISSKPLIEKRVSQVWTYYGKKNPLESQDKKENYRAIYASVSSNPVVALENSPAAIREVKSRWITTLNQPAAAAVNDSILARYEQAPRQVSFKLPPSVAPKEGQAISVSTRIFLNSQGDPEDPFLAQVLQVERIEEGFSVLCEEVKFTQIPAGIDRAININEDIYNANLRDIHDSIYTPPATGMTIRVYIADGVRIGSLGTSSASFDVGSWPAGVTIEIHGVTAESRIQGAGGDAGYGSVTNGSDGGTALYTRHNITIYGDLKIWGGGGGGGGSLYYSSPVKGGGGAGIIGGVGSANGDETVGGSGFPWPGSGGGPGANGSPALTSGGLAGNAIDGISYVTIIDTPNILGPQIN